MPEIGELTRGKELGHKDNSVHIFAACPDCGKGKWTPLVKGKPYRARCRPCAILSMKKGENNGNWKGGVRRHNGYILIYLSRENFFSPMANGHLYVLEHRLVMAKHIGRNLHRWEIVHHKNHIKDDNRIENLQLVTDDRHKQISILEQRITYLETRVTLLEAENVLLRNERTLAEEKH